MKKIVKEMFKRIKPHCNIGTIGHVDHGKTTLTAAITKVLSKLGQTEFKDYDEIDKHQEERKRGITITATHVEYETEKRHYSHIDCPGHQHYIKNMITGATQLDGVILVISIVDGPQEQTREHVILAREVGIKYMVIYLNKLDALKEKEIIEYIKLEIYDLLQLYGYEESPMIMGSAKVALDEDNLTSYGGETIVELMKNVDEWIPQPERKLDGSFLMPIDGIYQITGRGIVVTGKIETGKVLLNDNLDLVGKNVYKVTCMGIEMYKKSLETGEAGENVGVLIKGKGNLDIKKIKKGDVLSTIDSIKSLKQFEAKVYILTPEEGGRRTAFSVKYKPQFFFRTSNVTGQVILPDYKPLVLPGDSVIFNVELIENCPLNVGLRFAIREGRVTVGAGIITKLL